MFTGTLTKCDTRREKAIDWNYTHRYSPNTEHYQVYLDCAMRLDDGSMIYFKSPSVKMNVANAVGAAIVIYHIEDDNPWFAEVGNNRVATQERSNDNHLYPRIKVGDTITIKGRLKADRVSKVGNAYKVLTHVKRV